MVEVEQRLKANNIISAYALLRPWYKKYNGQAPVPSEAAIAQARQVYADLFQADQRNQGTKFSFLYNAGTVTVNPPCNAELGKALGRMRQHKAPVLTGIRVDHLKKWYTGTYPDHDDNEPDLECVWLWVIVSKTRRECFKHGTSLSAFLYGKLVIIPKDDKGGIRKIGLLESINKLILAVINLQITEAVTFGAAVYGFQRKRGCLTAAREAKLRMKRAVC